MVAFHKDFRISRTVADEITFRNKNPGRVRAFRADSSDEFGCRRGNAVRIPRMSPEPRACSRTLEQRESVEITKEAVGVHVLLTRLLFGGDIPRRFLRRVSVAKPTSAPLRF